MRSNGDARTMRLESDIKGALVPGITIDEAESRLDQLGIAYSFVEKEHELYGLVPDVKKNWLASESIQIIVSFDDEGQLSDLNIRRTYTGP